MRFLLGLLLGIVIGVAGYWYLRDHAEQHPEAEARFQESAARARDAASDAAHNMSEAFKAKMETLKLGTNNVSDELTRTGKVFRSRVQEAGEHLADAASDAKVITVIKSKYLIDPDLSAWKISVACDQGHVNLSGSVSAPENVAKAVAIALDVNGVQDVTYTLDVKPKE